VACLDSKELNLEDMFHAMSLQKCNMRWYWRCSGTATGTTNWLCHTIPSWLGLSVPPPSNSWCTRPLFSCHHTSFKVRQPVHLSTV
jgi:hypothetical protein